MVEGCVDTSEESTTRTWTSQAGTQCLTAYHLFFFFLILFFRLALDLQKIVKVVRSLCTPHAAASVVTVSR